jgi:hypothetical protein
MMDEKHAVATWKLGNHSQYLLETCVKMAGCVTLQLRTGFNTVVR